MKESNIKMALLQHEAMAKELASIKAAEMKLRKEIVKMVFGTDEPGEDKEEIIIGENKYIIQTKLNHTATREEILNAIDELTEDEKAFGIAWEPRVKWNAFDESSAIWDIATTKQAAPTIKVMPLKK